MRRALFLDRDGVICEALPRGKFLVLQRQFRLMPGICDLINQAKKINYLIIVISNQPQIARGLVSGKEVAAIHKYMVGLLKDGIDGIYYCPHDESDCCFCRKPRPGLILKASQNHDIDIPNSIFLGDSWRDIVAGQAVGCHTIFIRNQYNGSELKIYQPDFIVNSLAEAKRVISKLSETTSV